MHEDIEYVFNEYSETPKKFSTFTDMEMGSFREVFPEYIVELYEQYGRFTFRKGHVHGCHPNDLRSILALVFGADADLSHKNCFAYAYTSFGVVSYYDATYGGGTIDLTSGNIISSGLTKKIPKFIENGLESPFADKNESYDPSGKPMFSRARKRLGELDWGQCYGFAPALAMGGERKVENLKVQPAFAHFAFLAQLQPFYLQDIQGITPAQQPRIREIG